MKIYKIILLITILTYAVGCDDKLDLQPAASVSDALALQSSNDFKVAIAGINNGLQSTSYYGRSYMALADASSDNGNIPAGAGARLTTFYTMQLNPTDGNVSNVWAQIYDVIARANNVINALDAADLTENETKQFRGECLFIRALGHHDLVRLFAHDYKFTPDASHDGIPYVTVTQISEPSREAVGDIYTKIIEDLDNAITDLTGNSRTIDREAFGTEWSAKALRARVKLYMGDFSGALLDANDVIDNGGFSPTTYEIVNGSFEAWASRAPTTESIFELETDLLDGASSGLNGLASIYNRQDGYGDLGPNMDIIDLYTANDIRRNWYLQQSGIWFVNKYPGQGGNVLQFTIPIIRLSEMILIKAEALANANDDPGARAALKIITDRANAPEITSTGSDLKNDIQEERRRELAFEGHRYFDIKRLQIDIIRNDCSLEENCIIPYGTKLFAYPIPQDERDANENMGQNDGY